MEKKSIQLSLNLLSIVLIANISLCSQEQPQTQFPLHDAASRGDLATVMSLCEQGVPMDAVDHMPSHARGVNPLHVAANCGHLPVVQFLAGIIDVDATDAEDRTPFFIACFCRHFEVAKYLYTIGANVNLIRDGYTALHFACTAGNLEFVKFLTRVGLYHTKETDDGDSPLILAIEEKKHDVVTYLCTLVTNEDIRRGYLDEALWAACGEAEIDSVKVLLESGANVNGANDYGFTPLHIAVSVLGRQVENQADTVRHLLSKGAQIDAVDNNGDTVLDTALCNSGPEVIQLLWNQGAHFRQRNKQRKAAFGLLCKRIPKAGISKRQLLRNALFIIRFGIFINKKHKKVLEAENQALHEQWAETATNEQKKQMITRPRPIYLQLIQEEKKRLLRDMEGTYVEALPRDLQGLLLEFIVSQTPSKRKRDTHSSGDGHSHKKNRKLNEQRTLS